MDRMDRIATGVKASILIVIVMALIVIVRNNFSLFLAPKEKRPVVEEVTPGTMGVVTQPPEFMTKPVIIPRLAEIINTSKRQVAEYAAIEARLKNLREETGIFCMNYGADCEKLFNKIAEEKDVVIALKTISGAGVHISIWPHIYGEKIFINDRGSLIIEDVIEMSQLKQFLGIK